MELLEEEEVGILRKSLEVIWASLTNVANTGSKAHLNFACTQAKLGISSEGWGMEIVLVNKQVCYPSSTIKLELCLFLTILLWNWNFCCDCIWLRFCVHWLKCVWVIYQLVRTGKNKSRCKGISWREKEIANIYLPHTLSTSFANSSSFTTRNKCGQKP